MIHKVTLIIAVATAVVGLLLFLPFDSIDWLSYSVFLTIHVLFGVALAILLVLAMSKLIPAELFHPFKQGFKKWNGIKLLFYFFLTILSGVILMFVSPRWLIYFHVFIGFWAMFVSWRHVK